MRIYIPNNLILWVQYLDIGSMTSPALVLILGLIIFKWAVRGTNVAPTGALILACEKKTVTRIPIILSNNILYWPERRIQVKTISRIPIFVSNENPPHSPTHWWRERVRCWLGGLWSSRLFRCWLSISCCSHLACRSLLTYITMQSIHDHNGNI